MEAGCLLAPREKSQKSDISGTEQVEQPVPVKRYFIQKGDCEHTIELLIARLGEFIYPGSRDYGCHAVFQVLLDLES